MVLLILIWELVIIYFRVPLYILPKPSDIIKVLITERDILLSHMGVTFFEAIIGVVISTVIAVPMAIIMDMVPLVKNMLYPLLIVSQNIPTIILAPIFMIFMGFGLLPKIVTVALMCFFPIVISLTDGMGETPIAMVDMLKQMGAGKLQVYQRVRIPFASTNFFSGLKVAATYSVMGAVVGEWLGGDKGLGLYMLRSKNGYMLDKIFAAVVLVVLLSIFMNGIVIILQKILAPWTQKKKSFKE